MSDALQMSCAEDETPPEGAPAPEEENPEQHRIARRRSVAKEIFTVCHFSSSAALAVCISRALLVCPQSEKTYLAGLEFVVDVCAPFLSHPSPL